MKFKIKNVRQKSLPPSTLFCITALSCFFLFSACGAFSKRECEQMDWNRKGRESAMRGETLPQGQKFFEDECHTRHEVTIDQKSYGEGYNDGLKQFCSPEYVRQFGENGGHYQNTCAQVGDDKIIERFRGGRIQFLEKQVVDLEAQISNLQSENAALHGQLKSCNPVPVCPICP